MAFCCFYARIRHAERDFQIDVADAGDITSEVALCPPNRDAGQVMQVFFFGRTISPHLIFASPKKVNYEQWLFKIGSPGGIHAVSVTGGFGVKE